MHKENIILYEFAIGIDSIDEDNVHITVKIPKKYNLMREDMIEVFGEISNWLSGLAADNMNFRMYDGAYAVTFDILKENLNEADFPGMVSSAEKRIKNLLAERKFACILDGRGSSMLVVKKDKYVAGNHSVTIKLRVSKELSDWIFKKHGLVHFDVGDISLDENCIFFAYSVPETKYDIETVANRFIALHFGLLSLLESASSSAETAADEIVKATGYNWFEGVAYV